MIKVNQTFRFFLSWQHVTFENNVSRADVSFCQSFHRYRPLLILSLNFVLN